MVTANTRMNALTTNRPCAPPGFAEASRRYHNNPEAFSLRAMNILYEGIKEKSSLVIVPSNMVESLNPGGILGYANRMGMKKEE